MGNKYHSATRPSALELKRLADLIDVATRCYERGWVAGTAGNFSISLRPGLMWMSPSGVCKGEMTAESFVPLLTNEEQTPVRALYKKPSDEAPLHAAVLRLTEAKAVVHVHPESVVTRSLSSDKLSFSNLEMIKAFGIKTHEATLSIPMVDNTQDIAGLARSVSFEGKPPVLVLRGHGVYGWGATPQNALNFIEALVQLCGSV